MMYNIRLLVTLLFSFVCVSVPAHADTPTSLKIGELTVSVWTPDGKPDSKAGWPVIIFSHDFHACSTQSAFLMQTLASMGYAVFAPNHHDASCGNPLKLLLPPDVSFDDASRWTVEVYADRASDIHKMLDILTHDKKYTNFDWNNIGMIGYGLGGYTALSMAGAWPDLHDERIKAALVFSPYTAPLIANRSLAKIDVPVMYQGGTRDENNTPAIEGNDGAYAQTLPPKLYIDLSGASHSAWSNAQGVSRPVIESYASAFFDHYLKNKPFPDQLTKGGNGITKIQADMKR